MCEKFLEDGVCTGHNKSVTKLREQDRAKASAPLPPPPVVFSDSPSLPTLAFPPSELNHLTYQPLNTICENKPLLSSVDTLVLEA